MRKKLACIVSLFVICLLFCVPALSVSPETVVIEEDAVTIDLAVSDTYTLSAYVLPEGANQALNWYSAKNSTLSVKDGVLTAHRTGRIAITANIPKNGKIFDQCVVTIVDSRNPTSVTVTGAPEFVEPTQTVQLTASVEPALAGQEVVWQSFDTHIATVDENGLVTAKRPGTVYIRARAMNNKNVYGQIKLSVRYKKAPDSIDIGPSDVDLYVGKMLPLAPVFEPSDVSRIVRYSSSDPSVASVSEDGIITAHRYGKCTITVKSAADTDVDDKINLRVLDERIPDVLIAYPSQLNLEPSNVRDIQLLILPETLNADLVWTSNSDDVVTVSPEGRVVAVGEGEATITIASAYASTVNYRIPVRVEYGKTIKDLQLSQTEITIHRGEEAHVDLIKTPEDAGNAIAFEYSNPGICEMNDTGRIVALRRGETVVSISSYKDPEISVQLKVIVEDDLSPLTCISTLPSDQVLAPGDTIQPEVTFLPENADQTYTWTCSNPEIASVDESGVITAHSPGVCRISAVNNHAKEIFFEFVVTVQTDEYTLVMPERRTDKSGLAENMQKIENVRLSAQKMLLKDYEAGLIEKKEYERRSEVIDGAFEMYAFPWMVESVRKYWMDIHSENGMKDFKPGVMYYGLPYISGGSSARTYDVDRALEAGWYHPAQDGDYYMFDSMKEEYYGPYVGSDCSSFISLAYFGNAVHNNEIIKTYTLFYDDRFHTTDDPENLRAGDIMVRHSIHVIMFLYWADEAHTQAVFIEQGGSEPGINTVSTSVYTVSDYFDNFYHIRSPFAR